MKRIEFDLNLFVEEGLIDRKRADDTFRRITTTTDLAEVAANSDFVTEAIIDRPSDKRKPCNKLDELCPPHTIIASNTSTLALSTYTADVKRQDKIVLTHYYAPIHIVPGLEVAKGLGTSDETINITCELMKKIRKVPVRILKEKPGYLLNSIQGAMTREAFRLWAEGFATAEDIRLGIQTTFGFRMPEEDCMSHYDMGGSWGWALDTREAGAARRVTPDMSPEVADKIRKRMIEGKPWFFEPEQFDEVLEKRDRVFIRRLKELYWSKEK